MRRYISLAGLLVLALTGCGGAATKSMNSSVGASNLTPINPPAYLPGPLDGLSTPRAIALRRPLAVIVENYAPDSRPQTGLGAASTVIETLAEGGVTRFMAIYLEHDAPKVGPVRSTRMYFDDWADSFHAILTHVGGNDDAQAALWHLPKVFNVDENKWEVNLYNTGTKLFWRSADRVAPHNMYTDTRLLRSYATRNHQDWPYTNAYLLHKAAAPLKSRGRAGTITISFRNPLYPQDDPDYDVQYVYNRSTDTYTRYMGGSPHIDAATGKTLAPANVIVMHTGAASADPNAGPTPQSILIPVIGSGAADFFRDGTVVHGRWSQPNSGAPLRFTSHGKDVAFNPGQTWIEVVPQGSPVSWQFR